MSDQFSDNDKKPVLIRWLSLGVEFGGVIAIFCYMGYKIDAAFNTSPWFLLGGFVFSFIGMLYLIFKQVKDIWRK